MIDSKVRNMNPLLICLQSPCSARNAVPEFQHFNQPCCVRHSAMLQLLLYFHLYLYLWNRMKPILVWDIGFRCSPLSLLLYQSPFLLNPQTRLLCCNLFFKFMYVFFNVVFCTMYFLQPAFSTFVFCIFQSAFSSQRYLPTEPPSSHFYLLNSHRPTRRAAFKHKGFTRGLPIDVALNVSLQMPSSHRPKPSNSNHCIYPRSLQDVKSRRGGRDQTWSS